MVCVRCILQVVLLATATAKISHFWHITDIHLDVDYSIKGDARKNCWKSDSMSSHESLGRYGDYNCDSPWALVQSAARTMRTRNGEDIEFVLWTGDGLSVMSSSRSSQKQVEALQNLTTLFSHTFPSQFVFPVLGHDDPGGNPGERLGYKELAGFWKQWLPSEAIATFVKVWRDILSESCYNKDQATASRQTLNSALMSVLTLFLALCYNITH